MWRMALQLHPPLFMSLFLQMHQCGFACINAFARASENCTLRLLDVKGGECSFRGQIAISLISGFTTCKYISQFPHATAGAHLAELSDCWVEWKKVTNAFKNISKIVLLCCISVIGGQWRSQNHYFSMESVVPTSKHSVTVAIMQLS